MGKETIWPSRAALGKVTKSGIKLEDISEPSVFRLLSTAADLW